MRGWRWTSTVMSNSRGNIANNRDLAHDLLRIDGTETNLDKTIQLATISELDLENRRAKVITEDEYETTFLQFMAGGSDDVRIWNPPNVGDKVLILCMGGDTLLGYILPYILPTSFDGSGRNTYEFIGEDGLTVVYNKNSNRYVISGYGNNITLNQDQVRLEKNGTIVDVTDGEITLTAGGTTVTINSSGLTCNANISDPLGSMQEMRNRYNAHNHPGDSGGTTGGTSSPMV